MNVPVPAPIGLSSVAARRIRRITVATVLALALAAAVLSFSGLMTLAEESGIPASLAWLLPIIIDGLVITGSLGVIASTLTGVPTWYSWMLTLLGVTASVIGNVAAAPDDLMSQAVHATPPITFALAVEGLLRVYRIHAVASMTTVDPAPAPVPASVPITSAPAVRASAPSAGQSLSAPAEAQPRRAVPAGSEPDRSGAGEGTARERLVSLLETEPDISGADAARRLGIDPSHARRLLRELRGQSSDGPGTESEPEPDEPVSEEPMSLEGPAVGPASV